MTDLPEWWKHSRLTWHSRRYGFLPTESTFAFSHIVSAIQSLLSFVLLLADGFISPWSYNGASFNIDIDGFTSGSRNVCMLAAFGNGGVVPSNCQPGTGTQASYGSRMECSVARPSLALIMIGSQEPVPFSRLTLQVHLWKLVRVFSTFWSTHIWLQQSSSLSADAQYAFVLVAWCFSC